MIKHVIFTDATLAKVFCYDLAKTLTLQQQRAGTLAYSDVQYHPTDTALFAVQVDTDSPDVLALCESYDLVDLDSSWLPDDIQAEIAAVAQ